MITVLWVLTGLYVFFILFLRFGATKLKQWETKQVTANTEFTIVVPVRNCEHQLADLLKSVAKLKYPHDRFEVLLVVDASQDGSVSVCREFLQDHPDIHGEIIPADSQCTHSRKAAVETGVVASNFEYIVVIDAGCILPEGLLAAFNAHLVREGAEMLVGPVAFSQQKMSKKMGFLFNFQALDLIARQAITQGGFGIEKPFLAGSKNLCFSKSAFTAVNGFLRDEISQSGDFNLLLRKFLNSGFSVTYVKNPAATIRIPPCETWKGFLSRRILLLSTSTASISPFGKGIGLLIFLTNFALVLGVPAMLYGLLEPQYYFLAFVFKFNADFLLLYPASTFLKMEGPMRSYLWYSMAYPFISSWTGLQVLLTRILKKDSSTKR